MKILSAKQMRLLDNYTIENEPIHSIDLMERAAEKIFEELTPQIKLNEQVFIFCGMGNNGGDGLVIARLMIQSGYKHVSVFVVKHSPKASKNFLLNAERLTQIAGLQNIETENQIPRIPRNAVIIDAIFGTGLNKPVEGLSASVISAINHSKAKVFSVDIPSGLFCDTVNNTSDIIIFSAIVFTFHSPKLSFLLPQNEKYVQNFKVLDIGLNKNFEMQLTGNYEFVTRGFIKKILKHRSKFSHKGTYGHVMVAAGSYGKMGAAVLAISAALRSGAGLVTSAIPSCGYEIMQTTNPEAMTVVSGKNHLNEIFDLDKYNSIAVGPGIAVNSDTVSFLEKLFTGYRQPIVIDADALNIITENKKLLEQLPENSILTPHPGEFKRLCDEWKNDFEKLQLQAEFSKKYKVIVVLKGAHTSISTPQEKIYFNSTGNSGMAKGGSGDVLTGIIGSLLAQNYEPVSVAILGVYIHGLAGDLAKQSLCATGMKAGDLVNFLPKAFKQFEE